MFNVNEGVAMTPTMVLFLLFFAAFVPLVAGPDETSTDQASAAMTMTFAVTGFGTVFNAIVNRRDPTSGLTAPIAKALAILMVPVAMVFLATQLPSLQGALLTVPLTGYQWLTCIGLAALLPLTVELAKVVRRRRRRMPDPATPQAAVAPARALTRRR